MKVKTVFLIVLVLMLVSGSLPVNAAITPPEVVNIPYKTPVIDVDEDDVVNLSTALVGAAEIPFISYAKTTNPQIRWAHLATAAVPGNCGPSNNWKCEFWGLSSITHSSLSNVATEIYGPSTFGVAWVFAGMYPDILEGYRREYFHDMTMNTMHFDHLIGISKFGDEVVGAPSIELIGGHYRMAVVIRDVQGDFTFYKLVYMHYVGGTTNTSCESVGSGYQCDVIKLSSPGIPLSSPSLAYAAGDFGIAYLQNNLVQYAYPWTASPDHGPANCGPGGNTWRCITIDGEITAVQQVELAFGSDGEHAIIVYKAPAVGAGGLFRAQYTPTGGNCGDDGPGFNWSCSDVDAFIESSSVTDFAVTFDPNDYPVISWNNNFVGDVAQRLWISYPRARIGQAGGWNKQIVDGNDWSYTGTQNDISINSAGLTFIGYVQPRYRACGDDLCLSDTRDKLKAAMQRFEINLPIVMK